MDRRILIAFGAGVLVALMYHDQAISKNARRLNKVIELQAAMFEDQYQAQVDAMFKQIVEGF